jgi:CheY-like chemotaxis protein
MKILLADDDRDAVLTLQAVLEASGHQIVAAYSGADAIQRARTEKPDAAILDVSMPGMSGNDVAVALRREPSCEDILLIALTGWSSPEDRMATEWAGFDMHMAKPISVESLQEVLAEHALRLDV